MIDLHNHLIPGVDDGAADAAEARAGVEAMAAQGVRRLVCTPHVNGSLTRDPAALAARLAELDAGWAALQEAVRGGPAVELGRGTEVMLDTPEPDLSDPRLRLAGTRFVLVEFPFMNVPPNGQNALFDLAMRGWRPILAHPERYANARPDVADAAEWRRVGAVLQLNAGSLLGRYGKTAETLAWALLERGAAELLGSDYHARGRLSLAEARAALEARGASEQARLLMEVNPARVLEGKDPLEVPPVQKPAGWRRFFGLAGR